jgi:hypothetical protein
MCQPEHGHPVYGVPVLQAIRPRGLQTIPWTKIGPHGVEYKNPASDGAGLIYHNLIRAVQFLTQDIIWGPMQEGRGGGEGAATTVQQCRLPRSALVLPLPAVQTATPTLTASGSGATGPPDEAHLI